MSMATTTYSYQTHKGPVRLGSKVKTDQGPGAFFTSDTLKDSMAEQRRAFVGGMRTYGDEYDNYYQGRRWPSTGAQEPSFEPVKVQKKLQEVAKEAIATAVEEGAGVAQDGLGGIDMGRFRRRVLRNARKIMGRKRRPFKMRRIGKKELLKKALKGFDGLGQFLIEEQLEGLGEPVQQYLTEEDFTRVRCGDREDLYGFDGLGAGEPDPANVDIVTAVREIYGTTLAVKPLAEFVGAHPIMSVAAFMTVVGMWSGLASFVGTGGVDVVKELIKLLQKKWKMA